MLALVLGQVAHVGARDIGRIVAELNDGLVVRTLDLVRERLAAAGAGWPPGSWCWLAFGSEARREQTLRTDQDNGLVCVITDEAVVDAPAASEVVRALEHVCAGRVLVGHGLDFDLAVIARTRRAAGLPPLRPVALDTRRQAAALKADWGDLGLDAVAGQVGIAVMGRHTAEGDAITAARILTALLPELASRGLRTVEEAAWLQETVVREA